MAKANVLARMSEIVNRSTGSDGSRIRTRTFRTFRTFRTPRTPRTTRTSRTFLKIPPRAELREPRRNCLERVPVAERHAHGTNAVERNRHRVRIERVVEIEVQIEAAL